MATFDILRKEARAVENEIDNKLISYSKFGATFAQTSYLRDDNAADSTFLLNGDHVSSAMGQEIEQLLLRLSEINEGMGKSADNSAAANNYIANHRSKLHEYSTEFKRLTSQIRAAREHAQLLISIREDISQYKNSVGTRQDNLLRERVGLRTAEGIADSILGQGYDARENLATQRNFIQGTLMKVRNISKAFPGISRAVSSIKRRKKRDLVILATFIAVCMCLILLYIFKR